MKQLKRHRNIKKYIHKKVALTKGPAWGGGGGLLCSVSAIFQILESLISREK